MKRAIIIHGWDQRPDQEWLPWLYRELVANAGHFCSRDGYSTFPKLLSVVEKIST